MRTHARGVTIIELVIAMAVIAVALVSILGVVTHTTGVKEANRELQLAKTAATRKIEEIRTAARNNFDSVAATYADQIFNVADLSHSANPPSMQGRGTVTIDSSNPNLLDVLVRIEWEGIHGNSRYELRSLVTR